MKIGMVGLGRMGANMARRLIHGGHECVVFDLNPDNVKRLVSEGATGAASLDDFVGQLGKLRAAWVMVPAGNPTEQTGGTAPPQPAPAFHLDGGPYPERWEAARGAGRTAVSGDPETPPPETSRPPLGHAKALFLAHSTAWGSGPTRHEGTAPSARSGAETLLGSRYGLWLGCGRSAPTCHVAGGRAFPGHAG